MIPADVLTLAAAGGVTLQAHRDAAGRCVAEATYVATGGGINLLAVGPGSRAAVDAALNKLAIHCTRTAWELSAVPWHAPTAAVWRRRAALLRDLRRDVLATWPEAEGGAS